MTLSATASALDRGILTRLVATLAFTLALTLALAFAFAFRLAAIVMGISIGDKSGELLFAFQGVLRPLFLSVRVVTGVLFSPLLGIIIFVVPVILSLVLLRR